MSATPHHLEKGVGGGTARWVEEKSRAYINHPISLQTGRNTKQKVQVRRNSPTNRKCAQWCHQKEARVPSLVSCLPTCPTTRFPQGQTLESAHPPVDRQCQQYLNLILDPPRSSKKRPPQLLLYYSTTLLQDDSVDGQERRHRWTENSNTVKYTNR